MKYATRLASIASIILQLGCGVEQIEARQVLAVEDTSESNDIDYEVSAGPDSAVENDRSGFQIEAGLATEATAPSRCEGFQADDNLVACVDAFPATIVGDTNLGSAIFDSYACAPAVDESGLEQIIRLEIEEPVMFFAELVGGQDTADIDVHLLSELSSSECIDRGHLISGSYLKAGTYYLLMDSWVDTDGNSYEGAYSVELTTLSQQELISAGLSQSLADISLQAFSKAWQAQDVSGQNAVIVDYSQHARDPRFFVFDLQHRGLLFREPTTHGITSASAADPGLATYFDNDPNTDASSLGVARIGNRKTDGRLELQGIDPELNGALSEKGSTLTPFEEASHSYVELSGQTEPTPSGNIGLDPSVFDAIAEELPAGTFILPVHNSSDWVSASKYL